MTAPQAWPRQPLIGVAFAAMFGIAFADLLPQAIAVRGIVVSEPKKSARGMNSFLLRVQAMTRDGTEHPCYATFFARWAGAVTYGDQVQLFGAAAPTEGARNPGEFDMRAYL